MDTINIEISLYQNCNFCSKTYNSYSSRGYYLIWLKTKFLFRWVMFKNDEIKLALNTELLMTDDRSNNQYINFSYNCPELGEKIGQEYDIW